MSLTPVPGLNHSGRQVRVDDDEMARTLVAAVEIVSPANKDRPSRRANCSNMPRALGQTQRLETPRAAGKASRCARKKSKPPCGAS